MGKVTHCICHDLSFDEILAAARSQGISTLKQLVDSGAAGCGCALCHPYLRDLLERQPNDLDK
jgi:bacterioferritin-associated ferredoxin